METSLPRDKSGLADGPEDAEGGHHHPDPARNAVGRGRSSSMDCGHAEGDFIMKEELQSGVGPPSRRGPASAAR